MSGSESGRAHRRLVLRNATLVNGRGTPAQGPVDIVVEGDTIADVIRVDPIALSRYEKGWQRPQGDLIIDVEGMYVLPGLVDMHVHVPLDDRRAGPRAWEYAYKLWLGHGITTVRTCGFGGEEQLFEHRALAMNPGTQPIPRMVVLQGWPRSEMFGSDLLEPEQARAQVRKMKEAGADGVKIIDPVPETLEAICDEARKLGMRGGVVVHLSLTSEVDAVMASNAGVTSIEHTYGIPEAAIPGVQNYPPAYNEMNELDRFRQSAHNWIEAENYPGRVSEVLDLLIANGTVWNPTLVVYEANRDLARAQYSQWNEKYTTPQLLDYWSPKPGVHASFHFDWKTSDEVAWKQKYRIWMKYVKEFFDRGGTLVAGADAGSLYCLYGFSIVREFELFQEAGIRPIDAIKIATVNAARVLGFDGLAGGVRKGYTADLAVVDGNPLDNFKVMYGSGIDKYMPDGVTKVRAGGVRWTIRNGTLFDAPALLREVQEHVRELKAKAQD